MILYNPTVSGSLAVTGSLTTTGTITSQTLVVQTITSSVSYLTGSTQHGSVLTNTHQFTGSVGITGSNAALLNINNGLLYVSSSGNIGISTTNANYKLSVVGPNGGNAISWTDNANNTGYLGIRGGSADSIGADNNLVFEASGSERMRITATGLIGIGTSSPGSKLQVNGAVCSDTNYVLAADNTWTTVYSFNNTDIVSGMFQYFVGGTNNSLICFFTKNWNGGTAQLYVGSTLASNAYVYVQASGNNIQIKQAFGQSLYCYWSVLKIYQNF
jgi:hypothetical protein